MAFTDIGDVLDARDISYDIWALISDLESGILDADERRGTLEALEVYAAVMPYLGRSETAEDPEALADAYEELARSGEGQFIREDHFVEYARQLSQDNGDISLIRMPSYIVIDWEETAENLKDQYTEVEMNGVTYLYH